MKPAANLSPQAAYSRRKTAESAEIGSVPITAEQRAEGDRLRELCKNDLERFNVEVFPNSTGLKPFGSVQRDSIKHDEKVIVAGGKICKAEPRAYGKTTRTCHAALWGVLYGYRRMVPVFSANLKKSQDQIMSAWKAELMGNERLLWMFPDLVWPLRALDNKPQRCKSQTYNGLPTYTQWTASRIVFPHVAGVPGSGSVLVALPLKSCRGANHTTPDGEVLRPDLVIFDDVQRDEDAKNPNTITKIEEFIDHSAMMLGGHSQTMSAIMNCTVRVADDLSERYLSKSGWRRVRYKMLTSSAKAEKTFWFGEYAEARKSYDPDDADDQERAHRAALALYEKTRKAADAGAEVTWEWAYAWCDENPTEISAIQHAYNIAIDLGPEVFASECQNAPITAADDLELLPISAISKKVTNYARGVVPDECSIVTAFTDVQKDHLFWMVCAWAPDFTGYVIDYGAWPEQKTVHFTRRTIGRKLSRVYKGDSSAIMWAALTDLEAKLFGTPYKTTGGRELNISRWCIDGGYAAKVPVTMAFAKQSKHALNISLTKGVFYGAKRNPMAFSEQSKKYRTQLLHWHWQDGPGNAQWINVDTNFWKKRTHESLSMPIGSRGGIQLFKASPQFHLMLAEHLRAEKPVKVEAHGRTVYEFSEIPGRDNEGLDCLVGCFVAASIAGVSRTTERIERKPAKSLSEYAKLAKR